MTCGGCSGAVTRVLTKAQQEGSVSSFDVSLETQLVNVKGPIEKDALVEKIRKTGKEVRPRSWFSGPRMTYRWYGF
ncbi:uncharacterized protein BJ212DRAFT_1257990 [Suillus subaureus]|uniref:HMA domain-containing protein n=1 Tax=Suillus subaureus TaxID=48587 RepID=A0A9P7EQD4_9AGAM|nr:uncharacterized protein BJ212DRAFT_1257990 [Suillus subaureus]KAG1827243.1 hypothetical protein BJ212DRAFT_1257990 [Suillus subaureus]